MIIPEANSIRFYQVDTERPWFGNTRHSEIYAGNIIQTDFCQTFIDTDTVTVQCKAAYGSSLTCTLKRKDTGATVNVSGSAVTQYATAGFEYWEFDIAFAAYAGLELTLTITDGTDTYRSEPIQVLDAEDPDYLLIEWYNVDNAFQMDYSTDIVNRAWVHCDLLDYQVSTERVIFDNDSEQVLLKAKAYRAFKLRTKLIPYYLVEQLVLAMSHDMFFVNERQYTVPEDPELKSGGDMSLGMLTVLLIETNTLAINKDDSGDECETEDMKILNLEQTAATGDFTFTVTDGYLIQSITVEYVSGSGVSVMVGTSPDQDDIVSEIRFPSETNKETETVNMDITDGSDETIYVTVSGTSPVVNVYGVLIQNRQ